MVFAVCCLFVFILWADIVLWLKVTLSWNKFSNDDKGMVFLSSDSRCFASISSLTWTNPNSLCVSIAGAAPNWPVGAAWDQYLLPCIHRSTSRGSDFYRLLLQLSIDLTVKKKNPSDQCRMMNTTNVAYVTCSLGKMTRLRKKKKKN